MDTKNLSTLKIHKLSQEQYERELAAGRIDEDAIYLTPDEEVDLTGAVQLGKENASNAVTSFTASNIANAKRAVKIGYYGITVNGLDGDGVLISNDYNSTGHGYIDGKPVLGLYGSVDNEPVVLRNIEAPVQNNDAANKAYVDTKAPMYTYGTEDLEAGVSELATGMLYFVYE